MLLDEFVNGVQKINSNYTTRELINSYENVNKIYMEMPEYITHDNIYKMFTCGILQDIQDYKERWGIN